MDRRVCRHQCGRGELHADAVGNVRELRWELRRNFRGRRAIGGEQRQIFAFGGKFEVRMQFLAGRGAVFAGGEDDHKRFGRNVGGRETPFARIARAVRQRPVQQIDAAARRVLDFNPIRGIPVLIHERARVAGHEFGDADLGGGRNGQRRHQ